MIKVYTHFHVNQRKKALAFHEIQWKSPSHTSSAFKALKHTHTHKVEMGSIFNGIFKYIYIYIYTHTFSRTHRTNKILVVTHKIRKAFKNNSNSNSSTIINNNRAEQQTKSSNDKRIKYHSQCLNELMYISPHRM